MNPDRIEKIDDPKIIIVPAAEQKMKDLRVSVADIKKALERHEVTYPRDENGMVKMRLGTFSGQRLLLVVKDRDQKLITILDLETETPSR